MKWNVSTKCLCSITTDEITLWKKKKFGVHSAYLSVPTYIVLICVANLYCHWLVWPEYHLPGARFFFLPGIALSSLLIWCSVTLHSTHFINLAPLLYLPSIQLPYLLGTLMLLLYLRNDYLPYLTLALLMAHTTNIITNICQFSRILDSQLECGYGAYRCHIYSY